MTQAKMFKDRDTQYMSKCQRKTRMHEIGLRVSKSGLVVGHLNTKVL